MITLYGIKNCDSVKRARKALDEAGLAYRFHDFRVDGVEAAQVQQWLEQCGQAVINRRGTTWRKLDAQQQARADSDAAALLCEHSSLIKRPVIDKDGQVRLGFAPKEAEEVLAWLQE
nr:arsenate reductase [Oceanococcus sp. HetDA_MAG_MS8]